MASKILKGVYILFGVVAAGLFLGGILGGYSRLLGPEIAFPLFVVGSLLGVVVSIGGLVDVMKNGFMTRSIVLLLGLIPACTLVYSLVQGREYPMINDVSTDLVYPPALKHAASMESNADRNMDFPKEFTDDIESSYPDLVPQPKIMTVDDAFFEATNIVVGLSNWEITASRIEGKESYIEGTVTSEVFGFVDDFVIRIVEAGGGGCVVDMRSKSRMGKGDFGQNADHIREFMRLYQ